MEQIQSICKAGAGSTGFHTMPRISICGFPGSSAAVSSTCYLKKFFNIHPLNPAHAMSPADIIRKFNLFKKIINTNMRIARQ